MEKVNVLDGNKLIAKFMGWNTSITEHCVTDGSNRIFRVSELKYDSSWDWLMPVVEKIAKLPNTNNNGLYKHAVYFSLNPVTGVEIEDMYQRNFGGDKGFSKKQFYKDNLLENTYKAVIEFIKWYNENK